MSELTPVANPWDAQIVISQIATTNPDQDSVDTFRATLAFEGGQMIDQATELGRETAAMRIISTVAEQLQRIEASLFALERSAQPDVANPILALQAEQKAYLAIMGKCMRELPHWEMERNVIPKGTELSAKQIAELGVHNLIAISSRRMGPSRVTISPYVVRHKSHGKIVPLAGAVLEPLSTE